MPWVGHVNVLTVDRKSTRLNSSHRCISYAVFCLKKKNDAHPLPSGAASSGLRWPLCCEHVLHRTRKIVALSGVAGIGEPILHIRGLLFFFNDTATTQNFTSFPTRRSSD